MSKREDVVVKKEETENQKRIMRLVKNINEGRKKYAFVETYGCAQNVNDSQHLMGMLCAMGYEETHDKKIADVIIYNTCAVRENAELKVFGNIGALKALKREKNDLIIGVCGCMMQQEHIVEQIKKRYKHVDIVFGTHSLYRFPEILYNAMEKKERVIEFKNSDGKIAEDIPMYRDGGVTAGVSVMYGCNNFCTYCVVPYVRGRERSRRPEDIVAEARELVESGCKDITLLGQNVNSYGKDLDCNVDFADLIAMINEIPGEFLIRFMTSHPKDATEKLFKTMAECEKCAHQLHLPVQAGNDRVLEAMNRRYTAEKYLKQVELARSYMPDLVLTTDIIVGFPGETDEEFEDTVRLCEKVRYDAMFTFIYSKRVGTPAAKMPDAATREQKQVRFDKLLETANRISAEKHAEYIGKTVRVLVDGVTGKSEYNLSSRTNGGRLVHLKGDEALIGKFIDVRITSGNTWALYGEIE